MAEPAHDLQILEAIERDPGLTQAGLANELGVAVGKINWYLKRLINKGYIKVTHLQRRKLHYFLTPSGIALKLELTRGYMEASLRVYRELRRAATEVLSEVKHRGYEAIWVEGKDEATEILRLTCLEQGIRVDRGAATLPGVRADGVGFTILWPGDRNEADMH